MIRGVGVCLCARVLDTTHGAIIIEGPHGGKILLLLYTTTHVLDDTTGRVGVCWILRYL